tara:strand:- start:377 stop:733 length:357 start_codon:yes stop_codon:yes gene_type:complete
MIKPQEKLFNCTACGACCAHVRETLKTLTLVDEDKDFDFKIKDDGSCGHLVPIVRSDGVPGLGCAVYGDRPVICRLERNVPAHMTTDEYFAVTATVCNHLQAVHGVPDSYRVQTERRD